MQHFVYISDYLGRTDRGQLVIQQLRKLEADGRFSLRLIKHNRNEWCRDYMPVEGANGKLVLFQYRPHYLVGYKGERATIPDQKAICEALNLNYSDATDIILDGGAIDIHGDTALVSERFLQQNGDLQATSEAIRSKLGLRRIISIPADPWDFTAHVDGMVRFIDESCVIVNDYEPLTQQMRNESRYMQRKYFGWRERFDGALKEAGLNAFPLTGAFYDNRGMSANGIYLNFLHLTDCILMPSFEAHPAENEAAAKQLRDYYGKEVLPIQADAVAKKGGVINCITWAISE